MDHPDFIQSAQPFDRKPASEAAIVTTCDPLPTLFSIVSTSVPPNPDKRSQWQSSDPSERQLPALMSTPTMNVPSLNGASGLDVVAERSCVHVPHALVWKPASLAAIVTTCPPGLLL